MSSGDAIHIAVDVMHVPSRLSALHRSPLPVGMITVLEIAAGETETCKTIAARMGRSETAVNAAAMFFVEQVLLKSDNDSYRVLGAAPSASNVELRRNMAFLMRAMHPDRTTSKNRSMFAQRITNAWETIKTPERRAAYDRTLAAAAPKLKPSRSSRSRKPHDVGRRETTLMRGLRALLDRLRP